MPEDIRTPSRLRTAIDAGKGGDKIAFEDPAASPLGTDDEAAGTPPAGPDVARAARSERLTAGVAAPGAADERRRTISGESRGGFLADADARPWLIGAFAVLAVGAVVVAVAAL